MDRLIFEFEDQMVEFDFAFLLFLFLLRFPFFFFSFSNSNFTHNFSDFEICPSQFPVLCFPPPLSLLTN